MTSAVFNIPFIKVLLLQYKYYTKLLALL
jgi:hypothetical protein